MKEFGTIEQTVFFKAPPELVYEALLDAKKHSEFTGSPATANARVGSTFTAWDGYITGRNVELVRTKKIVPGVDDNGVARRLPNV